MLQKEQLQKEDVAGDFMVFTEKENTVVYLKKAALGKEVLLVANHIQNVNGKWEVQLVNKFNVVTGSKDVKEENVQSERKDVFGLEIMLTQKNPEVVLGDKLVNFQEEDIVATELENVEVVKNVFLEDTDVVIEDQLIQNNYKLNVL